ncbi:TonB-dependent receptor [Caldimonas thermodepolymerans]|uniref:TonB-dependent receptor n=1 Tax=Caldimonas thermodepolymerans TaxID=215580 RepID=A0A2S5T6J3_9BURK|nr:TonB-dependent receptor [Caldimonas thermodepolymerans]PPE70559.1 TonB-dependent receptor [Caldimonas thermodepolymerans]QPC30057.1 TonB-dependent receptor [Caldimonas thermodepolymerans]RDH97684.1 vitamin B12 transporter [Caldimonas thermodepolymerans]
MKTFVPARRRARWLLAPICAALPCLALAQERIAQASLDTIVVTATRMPQPVGEVVSDITVIDRTMIERSGVTGVVDVLRRVPGIELSRAGGLGGTTSLFVRGAEMRFTPVYVDGVRFDSQATGGASWNVIPLAEVERIEVVRGPAAAVYGSDAVSGVVQIFTRKGEGPFSPFVTAGIGEHHTGRLGAGVQGTAEGFDYAASLTREVSRGFDAQPDGANPDRDGHRTTSGSLRLGWQPAEGHRLEASLLANDMSAQYDGFLGPVNDRARLRMHTAALNWTARWSERHTSRVSVSEGYDRYETEPSTYLTSTRVRTYLWQHEWRADRHLLTAALERREDRLHNVFNTPPRSRRWQDALALGYSWTDQTHTLQLHLRHDDDSEFGGETTGSLAYAYALNRHWRVSASAGTAFRAPTLYQRFSEYGKATLRPESARNVEVGLNYSGGATTFGLVLYRNRLSDLIDFVSGPGPCPAGSGMFPGCYDNVGRAEYLGATLSATHRFAGINLNGSLDLQRPRNRDTDALLPRRARRHASLGLDTLVHGWTLGADVQLSSHRYDDPANTVRLGGYATLDLYASRRFRRDWTLLARVDNVGDKDHEFTRGYSTGGRTFYVELKWAPR